MDADSLVKEAEKKLRFTGGFLNSLFGSSANTKMEEAADLLIRAGNKYKLDKQWHIAADAYCKAANIYVKTHSKHDASQNYIEAANSYRKVDPKLAIEMFQRSISILTEMGRFSMAARYYQTSGEIYTEIGDNKSAVDAYEKAGDLYLGEDATSSANKCQLKVAELSAISGDYKRAIQIFESVAIRSTQNNLLKYSVKDYLFKASICQLCIDNLNAQMAIERYVKEISAAFADTREYKLIRQISLAIDNSSLDEFNEALAEFDKVIKLDGWCSQLLILVKKPLESMDDDSNIL
ncbi:hypothetical protein GJ496_010234 [Pomphorhynchus laevis]|nr:hypothetical protein GJ496_010234 [Pomphorhynchus laevis]